MVRQIAPLFFTTDIPATLAYYKNKLGFGMSGDRHNPPVYAIVAREFRRRFTFAALRRPHPIQTNTGTNCSTRTCSSKMPTHFMPSLQGTASNSLRELANTPWGSREFVVKDCDGRLLAFGANL